MDDNKFETKCLLRPLFVGSSYIGQIIEGYADGVPDKIYQDQFLSLSKFKAISFSYLSC